VVSRAPTWCAALADALGARTEHLGAIFNYFTNESLLVHASRSWPERDSCAAAGVMYVMAAIHSGPLARRVRFTCSCLLMYHSYVVSHLHDMLQQHCLLDWNISDVHMAVQSAASAHSHCSTALFESRQQLYFSMRMPNPKTNHLSVHDACLHMACSSNSQHR
jgi:hypothetical protein